ncbi:MAG TPA: ABC transporter ATP-binding protein [Clostridia bacterium]|jgi:branched-chain amino acid transport system ATP-binding protein|nr:ABC transporter ATP-binding protein [Clostridia bacterium]
MLSINGLDVYHGYVQALRNLSMEVRKGELLAVLGANGAGKSTLLGTLAGLHKPASGEIIFNGKNVAGYKPEKTVRQGVSLVPEKREIFGSLSVMDNLLLGGFHRRETKGQLIKEAGEILELFSPLRGREGDMAGSLSGGLQQMLAIGRALMAKPELLLLDEPSVGLAPLVVRDIMSAMAKLKDTGVTIILVEQNTRAALKVSDRVVIMERGTIRGSGSSKEPVSDKEVRQAFLGKTLVRPAGIV